jgi:cytochrome P450
MGPQSLLLLEGAEHLERRRLMLPPFHGERMRSFEVQMREIVEAHVERWPDGAELEMLPRTRAITLEVILRLVFGVSEPARLARLRELLPRLLDGVSSVSVSFRVLLASRLGRPDPLPAFAALTKDIDEILIEDIAARRAGGEADHSDVLSLLLQARFDDGSAMSDRELATSSSRCFWRATRRPRRRLRGPSTCSPTSRRCSPASAPRSAAATARRATCVR